MAENNTTRSTNRSNRTNRGNRARRTPQNKAMNIKAPLKSECFFNYTQQSGETIISAFTRVGVISLFSANDQKLQKIWSDWYEETKSKFLTEVSEVKAQTTSLQQRLPSGFEMPDVDIPDSYLWEFSVTTPQVYQLTNLILKMDELMHDIESLWLLGQVDAQELATARNQAVGSVKRLLNNIYTLTNIGKRDGGAYTTSHFMRLFREQGALPVNKADKKNLTSEPASPSEVTSEAKSEATPKTNEQDGKVSSNKEDAVKESEAESVAA